MEKKTETEQLYQVAQYFDDHFEKYVSEPMSKEDAKQTANQLNSNKNRAYVSYEVRPIPTTQL